MPDRSFSILYGKQRHNQKSWETSVCVAYLDQSWTTQLLLPTKELESKSCIWFPNLYIGKQQWKMVQPMHSLWHKEGKWEMRGWIITGLLLFFFLLVLVWRHTPVWAVKMTHRLSNEKLHTKGEPGSPQLLYLLMTSSLGSYIVTCPGCQSPLRQGWGRSDICHLSLFFFFCG